MKKYTPNSTTIHSIEYNESAKVLLVTFKNLSVYHYSNVPRSIAEAFISSASPGRFLNDNIKLKYMSKKVH